MAKLWSFPWRGFSSKEEFFLYYYFYGIQRPCFLARRKFYNKFAKASPCFLKYTNSRQIPKSPKSKFPCLKWDKEKYGQIDIVSTNTKLHQKLSNDLTHTTHNNKGLHGKPSCKPQHTSLQCLQTPNSNSCHCCFKSPNEMNDSSLES